MHVLVVNAGSSSLKYQLVHVETGRVIAKGICERVGSPESFIKHERNGEKAVTELPLPDHVASVHAVIDALVDGENPAIAALSDIHAIGFRIVHGGQYFDKSVIIDEEVIARIDELSELAPLHNKPAISAIRACQKLMPETPMVAVFDTSFFQTLPPAAYLYPIPYEYYEKYGIRKYGAHGTSHRYVAYRAAQMLGESLDDLKLITCHLGSGCSMTAIDHGQAIDTSMGFTPLDGLMMGTRCGIIDPAIVPFLMDHEGFNTAQINEVLNKKSGLLGISGTSNDLRSIDEAADKGDPRAAMAYEMFAHSVKRYLGSYTYLMAGVDAIVLTAGVGENSAKMRRLIFAGMQRLGIRIDDKKNKMMGSFERIISHEKSRVTVMVIPTDEEYMIAKDTYEIVSAM
ncbi:MAG: acetate kinase [Coriobacteriia bacterium]|nr:acetate kinase [Coriobacteriia bacterium]